LLVENVLAPLHVTANGDIPFFVAFPHSLEPPIVVNILVKVLFSAVAPGRLTD
jgi:hypothetical protein